MGFEGEHNTDYEAGRVAALQYFAASAVKGAPQQDINTLKAGKPDQRLEGWPTGVLEASREVAKILKGEKPLE